MLTKILLPLLSSFADLFLYLGFDGHLFSGDHTMRRGDDLDI